MSFHQVQLSYASSSHPRLVAMLVHLVAFYIQVLTAHRYSNDLGNTWQGYTLQICSSSEKQPLFTNAGVWVNDGILTLVYAVLDTAALQRAALYVCYLW